MMFTVSLKEKAKTLTSNFFWKKKKKPPDFPSLYPECLSSGIWAHEKLYKSSFTGVSQTFLSYNTALEWSVL